jgi:hypothetical protein
MVRRQFLAVLPVLLIAAGCGGGKPSGPKSVEVKGKVTMDGTPLANGRIVFDEGPSIPAAELDIKDGAYSGLVQAGKKTVRISAFKAPPAQKGPPKGPGYETMQVNILPAKYNKDSKETREVTEAGPNEFDFAVSSK